MDSERFSHIFSRLQLKLKHLALRIIGDEDEAEDAVQDVFCSMWRRRDRIPEEDELEWLMRASVRNRCISELRRRSNHPSVELDAANAGEMPDDIENCPDPGEVFQEVDSIISVELNERDRQILLLRDQSGWEFDEIAEKFGMTPAAVRMVLSRARKNVREIYRQRTSNSKKK